MTPSSAKRPRWGATSAERLARMRHADYVDAQTAKGEDGSANPSLVPWSRLPESLKRSNRRYAAAIPSKLDAIDAYLVPASGQAETLQLSEEEVQRLARIEHERWCRDLEADGWTWGTVRDESARRHPMLVTWSELPEAEREKDRDAVRGLPRMLVRVGYEIRRCRSSG